MSSSLYGIDESQGQQEALNFGEEVVVVADEKEEEEEEMVESDYYVPIDEEVVNYEQEEWAGGGGGGTNEPPIYLDSFVGSLLEAAKILIIGPAPAHLDRVSHEVPAMLPSGLTEATYLIDLERLAHVGDVSVDSYGKWISVRGGLEYFSIVSGQAHLVSRKGRLVPGVTSFDWKISQRQYCHADVGQRLFIKRIYKAASRDSSNYSYALISYKWLCEPFTFLPSPHGNSKKNFAPYYRKKPSEVNGGAISNSKSRQVVWRPVDAAVDSAPPADLLQTDQLATSSDQGQGGLVVIVSDSRTSSAKTLSKVKMVGGGYLTKRTNTHCERVGRNRMEHKFITLPQNREERKRPYFRLLDQGNDLNHSNEELVENMECVPDDGFEHAEKLIQNLNRIELICTDPSLTPGEVAAEVGIVRDRMLEQADYTSQRVVLNLTDVCSPESALSLTELNDCGRRFEQDLVGLAELGRAIFETKRDELLLFEKGNDAMFA